MNLYHDTMENCAPPEGMRERLKENVLSARPGGARTYRPRKKRRAALLLAAVLLLGTSATTIWDPLFVRRFGESELTPSESYLTLNHVYIVMIQASKK